MDRWMLTMLLICWIGSMDYAALYTRNETQMVQINLSYREVWSRDNVNQLHEYRAVLSCRAFRSIAVPAIVHEAVRDE